MRTAWVSQTVIKIDGVASKHAVPISDLICTHQRCIFGVMNKKNFNSIKIHGINNAKSVAHALYTLKTEAACFFFFQIIGEFVLDYTASLPRRQHSSIFEFK